MIRELKTLLAVARHGTFASAGMHIGLTQSAVSAQMQRLEQELGVTLFLRTGRSAQITEQGEQVLERAEEIIKLCSDLGVVGQTTPLGGKVTVGAIESAQSGPLIDALASFHHDCPGCRTRVIPGVSLNLLGMVDGGEVDLAVIIGPPFALPDELHWTALTRQPFVLLVPTDVKGDDWRTLLKEQALVRYERTSFGGRLAEQFIQRSGIVVRESVEIDAQDGLLRLVARGVGVALAPKTVQIPSALQALVRVLDLGEDTFFREIGLVQRRDRTHRQMLQKLSRHIEDAYKLPSTAP